MDCSVMTNQNAVHTPLARLLINTTHLFLFSYSLESQRVISWSDNAERVLGVTDADIMTGGNILFRHVHHQDLMRVLGSFNGAIAHHTPYTTSYRWISPQDHKTHLLYCRAGFSSDEDLLEGFILDISELEKAPPKKVYPTPPTVLAESSIEVERRATQKILTALPLEVVMLDASAIIKTLAIPEALSDFNFGDPDFKRVLFQVGHSFLECFNDKVQKDHFSTAINRVLSNEVETSQTRVVIDESNYLVTISALRDTASIGATVIVTVFDISKAIEVEKRLQNLQRLNEIRLLAAGVSHNINNSLQAVLGQAAVIEAASDNATLVREAAQAIQESIKNGARIAKQLSKMYQAETSNVITADLNTALLAAVQNQQNLITPPSAAPKLIISFGAPPPVIASHEELVSIISALLKNAEEATSHGNITVITDEITLTDLQVEDLPTGRYALLKIRDTGVGISSEKKAHCFAPFFTTKNLDKRSGLGLNGEGLGLSSVFAIVQNLKGGITIESKEEEGTTVSVYLRSN